MKKEERKRDYDSMCDKGKRCVDTKIKQGESHTNAVRDCWKKVDVSQG